jgi:hypothetical protein
VAAFQGPNCAFDNGRADKQRAFGKRRWRRAALWQGVMVVTDISLVGWLASAADGTRPVLVALAVITVALVTTGIVIVHRHIERRIDQIGKL